MEIEILPYQVTSGDTGTVHILAEGDYYWYRPADIDGGTSVDKHTTEPASSLMWVIMETQEE